MYRGEKTPDDLDRPPGNSLEENYQKHDTGEAEFTRRCEAVGLEVEPWGIDMRHDSGDEGVIYDNKMDFKVYNERSVGVGVTERELVALVDVKTKSNPRYMGRFNARHLDAYQEHAEERDVPVYVVMMQVDGSDVVDEIVYRVESDEPDTMRSSSSGAVDSFPDNNEAVLIPHWLRQQWRDFANAVIHK